jgi:hypothetical protein
MELLKLGEELGYPRLPYTNAHRQEGFIAPGKAIRSGQAAWEKFCHGAEFKAVAPALRNAKLRRDMAVSGMDVVAAGTKAQEAIQRKRLEQRAREAF